MLMREFDMTAPTTVLSTTGKALQPMATGSRDQTVEMAKGQKLMMEKNIMPPIKAIP
jgi:hypothetical protein